MWFYKITYEKSGVVIYIVICPDTTSESEMTRWPLTIQLFPTMATYQRLIVPSMSLMGDGQIFSRGIYASKTVYVMV